jgi:hypothetical protein
VPTLTRATPRRPRLSADGEGRARNGPGPELFAQTSDQARLGDGEAQTQAGEAIGLAERTQHHCARRQSASKARRGREEISEGLVDDKQATGCAELLR